MRGRHLITMLVLFVVLGSAACMTYWWIRRRAAAPVPPYRFFHGRVVDQDGQPISGAEVTVQLSRMVENFLYPGDRVKERATQSTFSVYSGVTGEFLVTLPVPKNVVEILDVKAPGYTWLIDWAWTIPGEKDQARYFILAPTPDRRYGTYLPDVNHPAVFVLVKNAYARPVTTMPSRGGWEQTRDQRVVPNEPHPVAIPSTGSGAPHGYDAINARISQYIEQRNAAATRQSHR